MAHTAEPPKGSSLAVARRIPASCSKSACTASANQFCIVHSLDSCFLKVANGGRSSLPACVTFAHMVSDCTKGSSYAF